MKLTQKTIFFVMCAAVVLALAVGCAKPPVDEMNNAAEAVTRAENDYNAVTYAGNSVNRAKDALVRMKNEADAKRYDAAKSYANEAIAAAERAINEGRSGAERARSEASAVVSQLPPLIKETEQGLNAAHAAQLPLDFAVLDKEFDDSLYNANEAQSALNGGRYQEALNRGQTARASLNDINQKLSGSAMAVTRKK